MPNPTMTRRQLAVTIAAAPCLLSADEARPNILWITTEDIGPALGAYGDTYAVTPNLDQLASRSVQAHEVSGCLSKLSPYLNL